MEAEISKGSEGFIHHMVVYGCEGDTDPNPNMFTHERINNLDDTSGDPSKQWTECGENAKNPLSDARIMLTKCSTIIYAWGLGGENRTILPDDVGFPFGKDSSNFKYIIVERHWDNIEA
jgi:hypothetical protein